MSRISGIVSVQRPASIDGNGQTGPVATRCPESRTGVDRCTAIWNGRPYGGQTSGGQLPTGEQRCRLGQPAVRPGPTLLGDPGRGRRYERFEAGGQGPAGGKQR